MATPQKMSELLFHSWSDYRSQCAHISVVLLIRIVCVPVAQMKSKFVKTKTTTKKKIGLQPTVTVLIGRGKATTTATRFPNAHQHVGLVTPLWHFLA